MYYTRDCLYYRHRLSHQQIDKWLGENRALEFIHDKVGRLESVKHFIGVTDRLRNNGISFICIKGPLLSYRIYNDLAVRLSHDIDLLIGSNQLDVVLRLLMDDKFTFVKGHSWPKEKVRQDLIIKSAHHISLYNNEMKFCVEIHWTLMNEIPIKQTELSDLISHNLALVNFAGREFTVFNKEFELLYLMVHGARHGWCRLKWLLDINEYPLNDFDFEYFNKLTLQLHADRIVAQTNYFLIKYFNKRLHFAKQTRIPAFFIHYAEELIKKEDVERFSTIELLEHFWYTAYLFPQFSYKLKCFYRMMINHGDVIKFNFSSSMMYYIYRPFSFIKRKVLHV